ncbi:MAG: site-2 protease family protein [Thermoleophilaceae bacterium]
MRPGTSLQLMRLFGIRIGVHPSWLVVLFLIIWVLSGTYREVFPGQESTAFAVATATALLFFASVILHELGHALVAMRNGISIVGIDLWLFGGLARMRRDTPTAAVDLRVAVAGPVVTLAIVVACVLGGLALQGGGDLVLAFTPVRPGIGAVEAVLAYLALINALLLVVNLIPGLPLDGGRIARAAAWAYTGDRAKATRFAARLGRGFGLLFAGAGAALLVYTEGGSLVFSVWCVVIGLFLSAAARTSELQSAVTSRISELRVQDVMDAEPVTVPAQTHLDRLFEDFFLRYRFAWFPVVDAAGRFVGLVRREKVEEVPESLRPGATADEVMVSENASGVKVDDPLEALLGSEELRRLGAVVALDGDGVLRGVVTLTSVQRALRPDGAAGS